jgi:hypothetical protein
MSRGHLNLLKLTLEHNGGQEIIAGPSSKSYAGDRNEF